jgi:hypothetical protein
MLNHCNNPQRFEEHPEVEVKKELPVGAIPFHFNRHIVFSGHFNDSIPAKWVFDTGCPYAVIDSSFFVENGYPYEGAIPAYTFGAGNRKTLTHILEDDHKVGLDTLEKRPDRIYLLDLRKAVGDKKADGILQVKYFREETIEINYQDSYLLLHNDTLIPDSNWVRIPFNFTGDRRIMLDAWVEIEPGVRIEGAFLLDLGSGGSFGITGPAAKQARIPGSSKKIDILDLQNGGIGGNTTVGLIEADHCGLGPFSFDDVPMMYSHNVRGALGSKNHMGIIGNHIMSRFYLIIDFKRSYLLLKPNDKYNDTFEKREGIGLQVLDRTISEGGFKVNGLVRKSEADSAGLQLGDIITHIDTIRFLPEHYPEYFYHILDSLRLIGSYSFRVNREGKVQYIVID